MKDFLRKLLASLLCICMIGSGLPVSAIAEAMQDSATPPEQQSVSGGAEEQGGQSAQTQASEEQGGTSAQTEVSANEANGVTTIDEVIDHQTFNLQSSLGIMPIAKTGEEEDFTIELSVCKGANGEGAYEKEVIIKPSSNKSDDYKLFFQLKIENNTEDPLKLFFTNVMDWNGKLFPEEGESGRLKYYSDLNTKTENTKSYSVQNGTYDEFVSNDGKPSTLIIPAGQTVVLNNLKNDGNAVEVKAAAIGTGDCYIRNTVKVWKQDESEDTAKTDSVYAHTENYSDNFTVTNEYTTNDTATKYSDATLKDGEVAATNKVVWWYTITNNASHELKLNVANALKAAGKELGSDGLTLSEDDSGATFDEASTLTLPQGKTAHLYTNAFPATGYDGLSLENTVTVTSASSGKTETKTSTVKVTGTQAVTLDVSYKMNSDPETKEQGTTIVEGKDSFSYVVKITNNSGTDLTLDLANALTVAGESITINKDGLVLTLDERQSTGETKPSLADGKLTLPKGAMAYLTTATYTTPYVVHQGGANAEMQFTVTATNSANGIPFTSEPLKLNIEKAEDKKPFKVIPSYSLDGVNFFEFDEDADLVDEIAHVYDDNIDALEITFRITIENTSDTETLYFCLEDEKGTLKPPKFDNSANVTKDHKLGTSEQCELEGSVLRIDPKGTAVLTFGKYTLPRKDGGFNKLDDSEKIAVFSFDVNEIKKNVGGIFVDAHGYHTQTRNVTLSYVEGVFGYSLSLDADADFAHISPEFEDKEGVDSKLYLVDGKQELYLIGVATKTRAKKYVHATGYTIDYFTKDKEITIIDDIPVAGKSHPGYQFICWFDKHRAEQKPPVTPVLFMPGDPIQKDERAQHTIDAIWVGLQVDDATVVYDGKSHNLGTITLDLAGRPDDSKYNFDALVVPELGEAEVTYTVKKNGAEDVYASGTGVLNTSADGKTRTITLYEPTTVDGVSTTATGTSFAGFTDVGVYQFDITADYQGKEDVEASKRVDPLPATCSATLTILPRPVVLQVASGELDWDDEVHDLTDDPDVTAENLVTLGAAFDGDTLKKDVSDALTTAIEKIGVGADKVSDMLAKYMNTDDSFADGDNLAAAPAPIVKYYPENKTDAMESVKDAGTYVAFISNIAELKASKGSEDVSGNYVFIGLPGELKIIPPPLADIELTKAVKDASFDSGTFTFNVRADGELVYFEKSGDGGTYTYIPQDEAEDATGGTPDITLTVTKGTEETPPASVVLKAPVGKTYTFEETKAEVTSKNKNAEGENYTFSKSDYDVTFITKDDKDVTAQDSNASVTVAAGKTASVTVTNTANFYFVQNYVSDLDNEGEPVKHENNKEINDKVLEGYPGYVADGALLRKTFAHDATTTYADVHKNETEGGHSSELEDQYIKSENAPAVNDKSTYSYMYDATGDGYVANASNNKYNANKTYLGKVGSNSAVEPGDTVNIFWDRVLDYTFESDDRYVTVEKKNKDNNPTTNEGKKNNIRQSEIKYNTDYALWGSLKNNHKGDSKTITERVVRDSWQMINAIDLTFEINKDYSDESTDFNQNSPRYIFNTVVTTQANGKEGNKPEAVVFNNEKNSVTIDNVKGGSTNTMLYLTPLIKVKYFVDDDKAGEPKAVDSNTYTLKVSVDGGVTNSAVGDGQKYAYSFTVPSYDILDDVLGPGGEYVQSGYWLLKTSEGQSGGEKLEVGSTHTITEKDLYRYSDENGSGIHVDKNGYLVVALYLTPAEKTWEVTKTVYDGETKLEDSAAATFGDTLKYVVTVKNTGNVPLDLYLKDVLTTDDAEADITAELAPDDVQNKAEGTKASFDKDNGIITALEPGKTFTLTYTTVVPDDAKQMNNSVTVDDDDDLTDDPGDTTKPVTKKTDTPIKNWSVTKTVTGTTGGTAEIEIDDDTTKTVGVARVGNTITYEVTITNTGNVALDELLVEDNFVKEASGASGSELTGPTLTSDKKEEPKATFANGKLQNLAVGETVTLTYTYKVASADQKLTNAATVADSEGEHKRESDKVVTPVTSFKVEKQVVKVGEETPTGSVIVKPNDHLVYTITIENTGNVTIPTLTVTDVLAELDPGKTRVGLPSGDDIALKWKSGWSSYDEATKTITNLPSGEKVTLEWDGYDVGENDKHIRNTATVFDGVESASAYADALVKSWTVEKSVEGMTGIGSDDLEQFAAKGDHLTYTIDVTNTGEVPMTLFVEDKIGNVYLDLTQKGVSVAFAPEPTGDDAPSVTNAGDKYTKITNLQPGQTATFTYVVVVNDDMLEQLTSGILNEVKVHAALDPENPTDPDDRGESDPHDETKTLIEAWTLDKKLTAVNGVKPSDPTFGKDAEGKEDPDALVYPAVRVGDRLTYTVTVSNTGSAAIAKIVVKDVLTSGTSEATFSGVSHVGPAKYSLDGSTVTLENLPAGKYETLTYTYTVKEGDEALHNAVTAYQPEAPEKTQEKTVTTGIKDWTVTKEVYKGETLLANDAEVAVGDELTYVVTVKNTGTVELKGLTLTDVFTNGEGTLDGMKHLVMDTEESADAEYAAGTWTIQPGGKLVLKAGYTVQPASQNPERNADTQLTNAVTVTDDDNVKKTQTVTTQVRSWTVKKTVTKTVNGKTEEANTALPGTHLRYTIQIENTGNVTLDLTLEDVFKEDVLKENRKTTSETDIVADLTADTYANHAAGSDGATFDKNNKKITGLEPGKTFTLYWDYYVPIQSEKNVERLVNTVTVDDDRDDFPPQSAEAETLIKNWNVKKSIAGVVDKDGKKRDPDTDGKYTLRPGDKVTYEVTVTNTGDTELTLYVEDSLFIKEIAGEDWQSKKEALEKAITVKLNDAEWKNWALFEDNSEGDHDGDCLIQLKKLPVGATVTLTYTFTVPEWSEENKELFKNGVTNLVYVHANDPSTDPETDPKPEHNSEIDPHAQTESRLEAWSLDKAITKVMRGEGDDKEDVTSEFVPQVDADTTTYAASVQLGDVVTYTITIKNEGNVTINRLNVVDEFTRSDLPGGSATLAKDDLTFWSDKGMNGATLGSDSESAIFVANLTVGETVTLSFTHTVDNDDRGTLINDVKVTRKGDTTPKEKIVKADVQKKFSWTVEKTVEGMSSEESINGLKCAKVGETLTYQIKVTNTGNETLSGLKLEDVFNGNGLKGQQPPIEQAEPDPKTLRYYDKETHIIDNLGAGQSVTLAYDYIVLASDIELVNTATVSHPDVTGDPPKSEVTTPVETTPAWKVTKEVYKGEYTGKEGDVKLADGAAVSVGDDLTYVITVENTGNTSLRELSVKDVFGGKEIQAELDQFSHDNFADYDAKLEQIRTLDAGRRIVLTYTHTVTEDDAAKGLDNAVAVTLPDELETDDDPAHHAEVANPVSAWTITKELAPYSEKTVYIGDTLGYIITITNNGSVPIESLTVVDDLTVTGWKSDVLDDMKLSADAPKGVTFTRLKNEKGEAVNKGLLEHLGAGQSAKIECTYTVPGGVYYTRNSASAYPTGHPEEEQKTNAVIKPMYALVTMRKLWLKADGKPFGVNELKQLIGNSQVKFDIWQAKRKDSVFKQMLDANGNPYVVTLPTQGGLWSTEVFNVQLGRSLDEDDYYLIDMRERGLQTEKDGKTQYITLNGHKFYYGMSYNFDGKTYTFTFTNELEGDAPTPTPTVTDGPTPTPTPKPTPSAYVPFTPTPGPAADAKYRVTKTAVNPPARGYYIEGETVQYSIRVQNTGMVPIDALTITDYLPGVSFTSGAGYDLKGAREAFIDHLSAGMSVEIYASYVVTAADVKRGCVTNTVSGDGGTGPDGRPASGNAAEATVPTSDATYNVTVHYLYLTDGTTAAPDDKISRLRPGDAYRFSCPTIDGYYASSLTVNGTMPAHDVEITVYYVPEDLLPSNGRGGPGLILLDEYGIPLGVGRVMLNVGDCFE